MIMKLIIEVAFGITVFPTEMLVLLYDTLLLLLFPPPTPSPPPTALK